MHDGPTTGKPVAASRLAADVCAGYGSSMSSPPSSTPSGSGPSQGPIATRLEQLLAERRPADALDFLEDVADEATETPGDRSSYLVRIWMQVGSRRALRALDAPLPPELAETRARFLASGPAPLPIPRGTREDLVTLAADLGARGLAHELAHVHLGLAELELRVDERLAHIEAAQALAQQLDDPALLALATAYQARLDHHLGEADDARDEAEAARSLGLVHGEPRAALIAIAVLAALDNDLVGLAEAHTRLEQLGFAPDAFGLSPAGPPPEGV